MTHLYGLFVPVKSFWSSEQSGCTESTLSDHSLVCYFLSKVQVYNTGRALGDMAETISILYMYR